MLAAPLQKWTEAGQKLEEEERGVVEGHLGIWSCYKD